MGIFEVDFGEWLLTSFINEWRKNSGAWISVFLQRLKIGYELTFFFERKEKTALENWIWIFF